MDVDQDSHDKPPDSETKPVVEQSESDMKIDEPPQGGNDDSSAETVKEEAVTEEPTVPVETVGMETDKPDNDDPMDQATEQSIAQDSTSTPNPDTTHEDHKTLEAHQPPLDDTLLSPTKRTAEEASDGEKRRATNFRRTCRLVWSKLAEHRCGNAFLRSPKEEKEPEYFKMIKRPMNLQIVKSRFREGETTTQEEFHRDIMLMLANTVMYNDEDSELFQMVEVRWQTSVGVKETHYFSSR
ncbi:Bromodomain-containing protein [Zopfochytrium polystomum]|nr:Bromodomain-containing protein [Zopfochytrium polystomum]